MALPANEETVRLSGNEGIRELAQRLNERNPEAVRELALRNCFIGDAAELCKQIGRSVGLRCQSCVGCPLRPRKLIKFILQDLKHLEHLELPLFEGSETVVPCEKKNVGPTAPRKRDVDVTHTLRRVDIEVSGDHNFELLEELLPQGYRTTRPPRPGDILVFTFTSELASVPFPYTKEPSSLFTKGVACWRYRRPRAGLRGSPLCKRCRSLYEDVSDYVDYFIDRSARLKCVHIHYRNCIADKSEQRVTWLRRRRDPGLLQEVPCFACCSTATFIGLVKPVNRDCEIDV
ncbi:hypothetical protein MTO96_022518 [Rhipicephalus appendiculatus]